MRLFKKKTDIYSALITFNDLLISKITDNNYKQHEIINKIDSKSSLFQEINSINAYFMTTVPDICKKYKRLGYKFIHHSIINKFEETYKIKVLPFKALKHTSRISVDKPLINDDSYDVLEGLMALTDIKNINLRHNNDKGRYGWFTEFEYINKFHSDKMVKNRFCKEVILQGIGIKGLFGSWGYLVINNYNHDNK